LVGLLAGFLLLIVQAPWQLLLPAGLPAGLATLVLLRLARPGRRLALPLLAAFLWGMVAAPALAMGLNDLMRVWFAAAGLPEATRLAAVLIAPAVEEVCKAAGLVLVVRRWRDALGGVVDGIVLGALVGIGFTVGENLHYLGLAAVGGGSARLLESAYLRGVLGGLLHPTFSATVGAALGAARGVRRPGLRLALPWLGLALAILQHAAWNGVGAAWLHAAPCGPAVDACALDGELRFLLLAAPAIVLLFIGPGLVLLVLAARRAKESE
jgi:RsiW-degrading membrane proteinase PrsW (M82 family)